VRCAGLLLAAALAHAQPVQTEVDTRSAAAGLDAEFRRLLTTQPQPAWIAYRVPAARNANLGCEFSHGVVHLEPAKEVVILFRVESNQVGRIRALSGDCEIDAGGLPVHWLTKVQPAQGAELLIGFVRTAPTPALRRQAMNSLVVSGDARATSFLEGLLR